MPKLDGGFYGQNNVINLSKALLGKVIYTNFNGLLTAGKIVETEAYNGVMDKASHAYRGRFTPRTQTMYHAGGIAYIYLCYGIHHLFNVVVGDKNNPIAILVRGIEPLEGIDIMLDRRKMKSITPQLTAGPGSLSQALGIKTTQNEISLLGDDIWIQDNGITIAETDIIKSPRVGVSYAAEHALLPWRFSLKDNKFVSKPKPI
ncbi:MAG: DNA-3-methyladenine glycosylase [Pedobacter sp.]|nr:MAG: DNA-3-methyladenine glycosylase [Pedobacter sp.]